jgi:hypothetical protein
LTTGRNVVTVWGMTNSTDRTFTCKTCHAEQSYLEEFPGGICLDCYAKSPEGRRMPTADEVVGMWGGGRR